MKINLLLKVLTQRNQNVGKNFYQMMKINIASINKTDVKCLANEFTASHFTNWSLIIICEEGAFHLHSTDGKNTFSQKSSGLKSSQEETDTYVVLYCMYAKRKGYKNVRIRTLDSNMLFICTMLKLNCKV